MREDSGFHFTRVAVKRQGAPTTYTGQAPPGNKTGPKAGVLATVFSLSLLPHALELFSEVDLAVYFHWISLGTGSRNPHTVMRSQLSGALCLAHVE